MIATFAAGCFWGVEKTFSQTPGVVATKVGYCGGHVPHPTYQQVCTGKTGHAESVRVTFDPDKISYETLLTVFWQCHNPTLLNRQGADVGHQYRSIIFCHSEAQRQLALASKAALEASGRYSAPIVTAIIDEQPFYEAEDYHQGYLLR